MSSVFVKSNRDDRCAGDCATLLIMNPETVELSRMVSLPTHTYYMRLIKKILIKVHGLIDVTTIQFCCCWCLLVCVEFERIGTHWVHTGD